MTRETWITGGRVVDGTGNPWFHGDVVLRGPRVAEVRPARAGGESPGPPGESVEVIDATGMVVCPGFIDIQSHSIGPLYTDGRSLSKVTQGVTSEIMGEMWTPAPVGGKRQPFGNHWHDPPAELRAEASGWRRFGDWLDFLATRPIAVNFGSFLGGGTVREYVSGWSPDPPDSDELEAMRQLVAEAMEDGAFGIAPALLYPPSAYSSDAELTELARVAGRYGGTYIVHMRSEREGMLDSLAATIRLAEDADVAVEIYHYKICGEDNWPRLPEAIAMVDAARARGVDIAASMYPYVASATTLAANLPNWAQADGKLPENLADPAARKRIVEELLHAGGKATASGPHTVLIGSVACDEHRPYVGKRLDEVAQLRGQPWPETLLDLIEPDGPAPCAIYFLMCEENLELKMRQPWMKFSTDAAGMDPDDSYDLMPHPRAYGTYCRVLGRYVRERGVLRLADAIRKMTSAVAARLGLRDRGLLQPGCFADVVVFDPQTVGDHATFLDPHRLSTGVRDVWVNGGRVLADGQLTDARPGRRLDGPGRR